MALHVDPSSWPLSVPLARRLTNMRYLFKPPYYKKENTRALSALVAHYFRLKLDKQAQLADWHLPLTDEMVKCKYIYILNCLKQQ